MVFDHLTSSVGVWDDPDNDQLSVSYQWYRSDDDAGNNEIAISLATANSYGLLADDAHKFVKVIVTVDDGNGSKDQNATSNRVAIINSAPFFIAKPAIIGTLKFGKTLSLMDTYVTDPDQDSIDLTYQWKADDFNISGAIAETFLVSKDEAQKSISCTITANDGYGGYDTQTTDAVIIRRFPWNVLLPGLASQNKVNME